MPASPSWPERAAICLDCRTVLRRDATCPHGHAPRRMRSLLSNEGREQLRIAVWGPPEHRSGRPSSEYSGGSAGDAWGVVAEFVELVFTPLAWIALMAVFLFGYFVKGAGQRLLGRWSSSTIGPLGADAPLTRSPACGPVGVVRARGAEPCEPFTRERCVAYSATLTFGRGRDVMLRDGATCGFVLELASGEQVVVPPGDLVVESATALRHRVVAESYASAVDGQSAGAKHQLFPHDAVELVVLRPGDRVELLSAAKGAGFSGGGAAYRDAAPRVLATDGPVRVRVVRPS